jgi:hypothetical protein
MAAIPYSVAYAFQRREYARSGAFTSHGQDIYSYGMLLAHWEGNRIVFDYERGSKGLSVTTSRHMRALEAVV